MSIQNSAELHDYERILAKCHQIIKESLESKDLNRIQERRMQAIKEYENLLRNTDITDYLLLDSNPILPKDTFVECNFNLGTLYKMYAETVIQNRSDLTDNEHDLFRKSISSFVTILRVKFEDDMCWKQLTSIFTYLCFKYQNDIPRALGFLNEGLLYCPTNETIHYNLGFLYQKLNKLELSLIHFKLAITLAEQNEDKSASTQLIVNCYNGISNIYRAIKQWPEALFFLQKAEKLIPDDPDIQNHLGVVYTEMRRTDLADIAYNKAISNYKKSFISNDVNFLLSDIYLNYGHMHSYNGDNSGAIEQYNKSLRVNPNFVLPFQNKIMNLNYLFDQLEDKMYILKQHVLVNKLYKKGGKFEFNKHFFSKTSNKINIGIVSGDFVDHPVSFFISTFLKNFDNTKFNVTCYSECMIDTSLFNKNLGFKFIRNVSSDAAARLIYNDNIHILFDLAGHTAFNRLDVFALKPAPIQITYLGYPYSTGLYEMDYRITDNFCDNDIISQKFYTEKLLYMHNCFLCYDPAVSRERNSVKSLQIGQQPWIKNKYITIGCYNRLNKITEGLIKLFDDILLKLPNVRFVFKTKALLNKNIAKTFLGKFSKQVRKRIEIKDCTILHEDHLLEYNHIDIAIDTFPYSGTTTSCEALFMGVPVLSLWDKISWYHCQNVTVSILKNSNLDFYVCESTEDIIDKIKLLDKKPVEFWETLKYDTRKKFLSGKVCDKMEYMKNFENLLTELFNKHKV